MIIIVNQSINQSIKVIIPGEILKQEDIFKVSYRFQRHYRNNNERLPVLNGYMQNYRWKVMGTVINSLSFKMLQYFFFCTHG